MLKVLIVDDSVVFRTQITKALTGVDGIDVVGSAINGSIALQKLEQLSVDIVTLDLEMPDMDGIQVLRKIIEKKFKVKVIVFSSQTTRGAEKALEALHEGADDVVAKPAIDPKSGKAPHEVIRETLAPKILQFEKANISAKEISVAGTAISAEEPKRELFSFEVGPAKKYPTYNFKNSFPQILVIASSTGGPNALESIFSKIKQIKIPIIIAQHMPPLFTEMLAKRLQEISGLPVYEAKDKQKIQKGHVYIAPGDFHLEIAGDINNPECKLHQAPPRNSVRPAADYLFESAAKLYGDRCVGLVLTGMGEDGRMGVRAVKECGGGVAIQSKETCVVFGMPGAVYEDKTFDQICNLESIPEFVLGLMN